MSNIPDRRPAIREQAWRATDLTWREKAYLVRVTELAAEFGEDGRRRYGSRGMDALGHFSLHRDYIAKETGTDEEAVRSAQRGCIRKGYIQLVSRAVHGLPNKLQAFPHRGVISDGLRGCKTTPLRGNDDGPHRGVKTPSLPLETPDHPDPERSTGGFPTTGLGERRQDEDGAEDVTSRPTACEAHGWPECTDRRCVADGRRAS